MKGMKAKTATTASGASNSVAESADLKPNDEKAAGVSIAGRPKRVRPPRPKRDRTGEGAAYLENKMKQVRAEE